MLSEFSQLLASPATPSCSVCWELGRLLLGNAFGWMGMDAQVTRILGPGELKPTTLS
jgi:hypothetical protein